MSVTAGTERIYCGEEWGWVQSPLLCVHCKQCTKSLDKYFTW